METLLKKSINKLIQSGYTKTHAKSLAERLISSNAIRGPLLRWVENDEKADCSYHDICVHKLMQERGLTYPAALSMIAWLYKDPDAAINSLATRVDLILRRQTNVFTQRMVSYEHNSEAYSTARVRE